MKKLMTMKNILIAIAFTVLLLLIKDNLYLVWGLFTKLIDILKPFMIGFLIAYILNFPYKFFYSKAFGKMGKKRKIFEKLKKPLAILCTYTVVIACVVLLISIVVPQIANNVSSLAETLPAYFEAFTNKLDISMQQINDMFKSNAELNKSIQDLSAKVLSFFSMDNLLKVFGFAGETALVLWNMISNTSTGVYNFVMGLVISVYFLASKEHLCRQIKRLAVAFIPMKYLPKVYEIVDIADTKCGRYLVGDIIDSVLVGLLTFIVMAIFQIPYAPLIAVIVGVTNIIPVFGPFIGAIPSAFILLLIDPWDMIWFIIIIVVIQQLDGNVLKPMIIGSQIGLSSFWVLFSVIIGGALFGVPGLILGTPIYAVIYSLIGKKVRNSINDKGRLAREALDFEVLNYTKIAEEQKKIREEKDAIQREKLKKLIGFNKSEDEEAEKVDEKNEDK